MEFQFECLVVKFLNKASARIYPVLDIKETIDGTLNRLKVSGIRNDASMVLLFYSLYSILNIRNNRNYSICFGVCIATASIL